jgi:predicted ribosome quality control (RQC) complex YloA/Tae2 family protein
VDYTEARKVKKPGGAPPGKVLYHTYNSVVVLPTQELIKTLTEGTS